MEVGPQWRTSLIMKLCTICAKFKKATSLIALGFNGIALFPCTGQNGTKFQMIFFYTLEVSERFPLPMRRQDKNWQLIFH